MPIILFQRTSLKVGVRNCYDFSKKYLLGDWTNHLSVTTVYHELTSAPQRKLIGWTTVAKQDVFLLSRDHKNTTAMQVM